MKTIVVDLDNTLTFNSDSSDYLTKEPNADLIEKLNQYHDQGFEIIVHTSRNMRTYNNNISKITKNTVPVIIDWLNKSGLKYDGLVVGKPWCGTSGFYIDDRAIRPSEFLELSLSEITKIINP